LDSDIQYIKKATKTTFYVVATQGNRIENVERLTAAVKNVENRSRRQRQTLFVTIIAIKGAKRHSKAEVGLF